MTPLFAKIIVFEAAAIVASPVKLGSLAIASVPVALALPKSTLFAVANVPNPKLVRAVDT